MTDITNTKDYLDVRDIIARIGELETGTRSERERLEQELEDAKGSENPALIEAAEDALVTWQHEDGAVLELETLSSLLDDLEGNGGDHEWRGAWYPVTLVRDSYFANYAQEYAEDIGAIPKKVGWPHCHIDWDAAIEAMQQDYQTVDFDGETYWYR